MLTIAGGIGLFFIGLLALCWILAGIQKVLEWLFSSPPHKGPLIYIQPSDSDSQRP
jgi:hypothetical protein